MKWARQLTDAEAEAITPEKVLAGTGRLESEQREMTSSVVISLREMNRCSRSERLLLRRQPQQRHVVRLDRLVEFRVRRAHVFLRPQDRGSL